jgi:hypothetical protein
MKKLRVDFDKLMFTNKEPKMKCDRCGAKYRDEPPCAKSIHDSLPWMPVLKKLRSIAKELPVPEGHKRRRKGMTTYFFETSGLEAILAYLGKRYGPSTVAQFSVTPNWVFGDPIFGDPGCSIVVYGDDPQFVAISSRRLK